MQLDSFNFRAGPGVDQSRRMPRRSKKTKEATALPVAKETREYEEESDSDAPEEVALESTRVAGVQAMRAEDMRKLAAEEKERERLQAREQIRKAREAKRLTEEMLAQAASALREEEEAARSLELAKARKEELLQKRTYIDYRKPQNKEGFNVVMLPNSSNNVSSVNGEKVMEFLKSRHFGKSVKRQEVVDLVSKQRQKKRRKTPALRFT